MNRTWLPLALTVVACGGAPAPLESPAHGPAKPVESEKQQPVTIPPAATLPEPAFFAWTPSNGKGETINDFLDRQQGTDLLCIGEQHGNAEQQAVVHRVLWGMIQRSRHGGRSLGLGLEMLPTDTQPALNAAATDGLPEVYAALEWEKNWGFSMAGYRPSLELALRHGVWLRALNQPGTLTDRIAQVGWEGLEQKERNALPPTLDTSDAAHRAVFDKLRAGHPSTNSSPEFAYQVQVTWDESMAAAATKWLTEDAPARQLVLWAGQAHCHRTAIPQRAARGGAVRVASVAIVDASQLSSVDPQGYDTLLVLGANHAGALPEGTLPNASESATPQP